MNFFFSAFTLVDAAFTTESIQQDLISVQESSIQVLESNNIKRKRAVWNKGEGNTIRSKTGKFIHHPSHNDTVKRQARCVVCCCLCSKDSHSTGRQRRLGWKTTKCCFPCAQTASRRTGTDIQPVALCTVQRLVCFGKSRTCWEIHHSSSEYPTLPCCTREPANRFVDVRRSGRSSIVSQSSTSESQSSRSVARSSLGSENIE